MKLQGSKVKRILAVASAALALQNDPTLCPVIAKWGHIDSPIAHVIGHSLDVYAYMCIHA